MSIRKEIDNLLKQKKIYDEHYYNGESIISDEEYDTFIDSILEKYPYVKFDVGSIPILRLTKKLAYPMWSMNKIKHGDNNKLNNWKSKNHANEYILEPKLDGISCLLICRDGKIQLFTRGNGVKGTEVSNILKYIRNIPKLKEDINIRGELIISRKCFTKYKDIFSNARNFVSGVVMSKDANSKYLSHIDFIPFELILDNNKQLKPLDQFIKIKKLGFKTIEYKVYRKFSQKTLENMYNLYKLGKYSIDGLIIQKNTEYIRSISSNPSYAIAYKFKGNIYKTNVKNIIWNVSKWGKLVPTIEIEPVEIDGVHISFTTGFNAKYIVDNKLGKGSIINITRAGDVIPYIVNVLKEADNIIYPSVEYKWNESKVDFEIICSGSKEQIIKKIVSFFKLLEIKFVSIKTVEKMYDIGLDSIFKVLDASIEDFLKIDGFKIKLSTKIYNNIHSDRIFTISEILGAYGTFGKGINIKKLSKLFQKVPNLLELYKYVGHDEMKQCILDVEGFSEKTTNQVMNNLDTTTSILSEIKKYFIVMDVKEIDDDTENKKLSGEIIVFSGFRDKKLESEIKLLGGKISTTLSKKTTYLVIKDGSSKSSKYSKALEYNINIINKNNLIKLIT